jgi:DNA-binding MarR family transcriptional regulator
MPFQRASGAMDVGAHYCATLTEIRAVWAAVSANPMITLRCLVERTGIKQTKVRQIIHFLEAAGYLERKSPSHNGRRVRIPMIWT